MLTFLANWFRIADRSANKAVASPDVAIAYKPVLIEELQTEVTPAPMSGELLFRASARLTAPPTVTLDALRRQLEALAGELMVDLDVDSADEP